MSKTQNSAKPVLKNLIQGDWSFRSSEELISLSQWAIMTAITYDADFDSFPVVTTEERRAFSENRSNTPNFEVWTSISMEPSRGIVRIGYKNPSFDFYSTMTTFQIGLFTAVVFYRDESVIPKKLENMGLVRIYPANLLKMPSVLRLSVPARLIATAYTDRAIPFP